MKIIRPAIYEKRIICENCDAIFEIDDSDIKTKTIERNAILTVIKEFRSYAECPCCKAECKIEYTKLSQWQRKEEDADEDRDN